MNEWNYQTNTSEWTNESNKLNEQMNKQTYKWIDDQMTKTNQTNKLTNEQTNKLMDDWMTG